MTKILLVNPRFSEFVDESISCTSVPFGPVCIGIYLEKEGYEAKLVNGISDPAYMCTIEQELDSSLALGCGDDHQIPSAGG